MAKNDLFEQVKELVSKGYQSKAQQFIEDHKADLGDYADKAKALIENNKVVDDVVDKVKGLFGK